MSQLDPGVGSVDVYAVRLNDEQRLPPNTSDSSIREVVAGMDTAMKKDLGGRIRIGLKAIKDVYVAPSSSDEENPRCYSREQIYYEVVEGLPKLRPNEVVHIVADDAKECTTNSDKEKGIETAAYALGRMNYFNPRQYTVGSALHEVGHSLEVGHYGAIECSARQSKDTVSSLGETCNAVKNRQRKVDEYASYESVMGSSRGENGEFYNNTDRFQLFPDIYKIPTIPLRPALYRLRDGENEQVGVSIDIPDGHPLKKYVDDGIEQLLFTIENDNCKMLITAFNPVTKMRYEIPPDDGDRFPDKRALYSDMFLGLKVSMIANDHSSALFKVSHIG